MPVFPGEAKPSVLRDLLPEEAGYVTYRLESNMHTGTHIDAPFHAKNDTTTIDKYPVELFYGSAAVIDVRGMKQVKMQAEWQILFTTHTIILFCTGFNSKWGTRNYYKNYPVFDNEIAITMASNGVRIAGFDSPSPDKDPYEFHDIFLRDERFLIENLTNLEQIIGRKDITFMGFPLKIQAEASLIRAVVLV